MAITWTTGQAFSPNVGECFDVCFGKIQYQGKNGFWTARLRIDGKGPAQWIDLDTNDPLDPDLAKFVVQAFRSIRCP